MEHISVKIAEKETYRDLLPLVASEARGMLSSDEAGLLLAVKDAGEVQEEVCGAVLFCNDPEQGFLLPSIYVKKEYRRQGIGALLLTAAQQQAQACSAGGITLTYEVSDAASEEAQEQTRFFLQNGYGMPSEETMVMTIPMESLADSCVAGLPDPGQEHMKKMKTFDELPFLVGKDYRERLGDEIPQILDRAFAPGIVIPDLTLAYVQKNQVIAFVVCSEVDGALHLHAAYVQSQTHAKALIYLVKQIFRIVQQSYPQYRVLTITTATYQGRLLAEKLLHGAKIQRTIVYTCFKPLYANQAFLEPAGFGEALVRFQTLTEYLSSVGKAAYLYVVPGELPVTKLPIDEEERLPMAVVRYVVDVDAQETPFFLFADVEFPVKETPVERLRELVNPLCDAGKITRAYWKDEEETVLVLEAERKEEAALVPEETVAFLMDFVSAAGAVGEKLLTEISRCGSVDNC